MPSSRIAAVPDLVVLHVTNNVEQRMEIQYHTVSGRWRGRHCHGHGHLKSWFSLIHKLVSSSYGSFLEALRVEGS